MRLGGKQLIASVADGWVGVQEGSEVDETGWQTTDSISCRWMGRRTGGLRGG